MEAWLVSQPKMRHAAREFRFDGIDHLEQMAIVALGVHIAAGDKKRPIAQQRQRLHDSAYGFKCFAFCGIGKARAESAAVAQGNLDLLALPGMICLLYTSDAA